MAAPGRRARSVNIIAKPEALPISSGQPVNTSCNRPRASPPPNSKSSLSWPVVNQVVARICGWAIPMMDRRNVVEYEADSLILCSCYVLHNSTLPMLVKQSESGLSLPYRDIRSEEHTSELQSQMRISYAVFCLKQKT